MGRYILILIVALVSCTKTLYVPKVTREVVIDTLVEQVPDSSIIRALLECDSMGNVLIKELEFTKGRSAHSDMSLVDNSLMTSVRWKTKYIDRYVELRDTTTVIEYVEVVKQVKHIPSIYKYCFLIVIAAVAAGVIKGFRWLKIF